MPVRYDIAAQIPQYSGGGMDPINMMVQLQGMDYRQRQNALADIQLAQAQREMQREQATAALFARQGFDPLSRQGLTDIARANPDYFQRYISPYASYQSGMASAAGARGRERREEELQPYARAEAAYKAAGEKAKYPGVVAGARKAEREATVAEGEAARDILRGIYLAHKPDQPGSFQNAYAKGYAQLSEVAPNIAKRLGPRPELSDIENIITSEKGFEERRKPQIVKSGEFIAEPSGLPGAPIPMREPVFVPNAMADTSSPTNAFVDRNRMQPSAGQINTPLTPEQQIIKRTMDRRALLGQVPPEDRPKVQSQLDLAETVQAANTGLDRLAQAGGIPVAGQTNAKNWAAKARTTKAGLALGNLSDSEVAVEYNNLRTIAGIMRQRVAGAVGLTARQMDAAKEMEAFEKIVGGEPSAEGLASAKQRLNTINELLGTGETTRFESPRGRGKAGEEPKLKPLEGTINLDDMRD